MPKKLDRLSKKLLEEKAIRIVRENKKERAVVCKCGETCDYPYCHC